MASSETQSLYALEETENFRWVAKFSKRSEYTLKSADLTSQDLQNKLSDIGQFAEVAHGRLSPDFIWRNLDRLLQPRFPLANYNALQGSTLVSSFHGTVANVQGYVAHRPNELVIAFSGTSNFLQTLNNVDARRIELPGRGGSSVHAGFLRLYNGVCGLAFTALANALREHDDVRRITFTGHSLGAVMCYLMALDVMEGAKDAPVLPSSCKALTIAVFGSPRAGNFTLVQRWREVIANRIHNNFTIEEYSVKGYNDGVPSIPPQFLGFYHFAQKPFYFANGCLYHIPSSESEATFFNVTVDTPEHERRQDLRHPLGGHNYYNNRDMEKVLRTMKILLSTSSGEPDWDGYLGRLPASEASIIRGNVK